MADRYRHEPVQGQAAALDAELVGDGAPHIDETLDAVLKLPPKYKDVIYLHYYMGYKTDRIAEMLEKPPSTVRNHLREARELLRKLLGGIQP